MEPRLRILTILLMEKMAEQPDYAAGIGVEGKLMKQPQTAPSEGAK